MHSVNFNTIFFTSTRLQPVKVEKIKIIASNTLLSVDSNFSRVVHSVYVKFVASFSKISLSHSIMSTAHISTAHLCKWNNKHIKLFQYLPQGGAYTSSCISFESSSHSKLMFWCHSLYGSRITKLFSGVQSTSPYTSMPLSFLVLFEIHSVDWFGLVFVLPLLKYIKKKISSVYEISYQTRHVLVQWRYSQYFLRRRFFFYQHIFHYYENSGLFLHVMMANSPLWKVNFSDTILFQFNSPIFNFFAQ